MKSLFLLAVFATSISAAPTIVVCDTEDSATLVSQDGYLEGDVKGCMVETNLPKVEIEDASWDDPSVLKVKYGHRIHWAVVIGG